jgi:AcrR family transcriptional regulator
MEKDSAARKDNLLQAAVMCFAHNGYQATTLDDIAEAAAVTKGAIYWHFKDKSDVFRAVIDERGSRLLKAIQDAMEQEQPAPQRLRGMILACLTFYRTYPEFAALLARLRSVPEPEADSQVVADIRQTYRQVRSLIGTIVQEGAIEGSMAAISPEIAAVWIVSLVDGLILQWIFDPDSIDPITVGSAIADYTLELLRVQ